MGGARFIPTDPVERAALLARIRELYEKNEMRVGELSQRFGVNDTTIRRVLTLAGVVEKEQA